MWVCRCSWQNIELDLSISDLWTVQGTRLATVAATASKEHKANVPFSDFIQNCLYPLKSSINYNAKCFNKKFTNLEMQDTSISVLEFIHPSTSSQSQQIIWVSNTVYREREIINFILIFHHPIIANP